MVLKLKVARTAKELDDVYKLRYEVFVLDKQKFTSDSNCGIAKARIVDQFDSIPGVFNIIVYNDEYPIATMRVNKDSEIGLPSEMHFDFTESRDQVTLEYKNQQLNLVFVSASMLAIKKQWRNRRNMIQIMFKTAINIMQSLNSTHIITTMSIESQSLCNRLGFKVVGMPQWNEAIGDHLIPMLAPFEKVFHWGFGDTYSLDDLSNKQDSFDKKTNLPITTWNKIERRKISREYLQNVA